MKYHEKLRFLNKSYFNKIYVVLVLSFTYMAFDIFMLKIGLEVKEASHVTVPGRILPSMILKCLWQTRKMFVTVCIMKAIAYKYGPIFMLCMSALAILPPSLH